MKTMTKITLITASIMGMSALTACQSTNTVNKDQNNSHMMGHHHKHDRNMTPEQREQFKQKRAEHKAFREQIRTACDGKTIGQSVQVKAGDKTVDGTCNVIFKADRKAMKNMKHGSKGTMMHGHSHTRPDWKNMTEEQRVQLKQQFAQKRIERKAQWEAIQKSCTGQSLDKTIQVKMGDKTIDGKCVVKFQPQLKAEKKMQTVQPTA